MQYCNYFLNSEQHAETMLKLWMAMTTGSMAKELNTRRGEGLHSRARSEHLIKKKT